MATNENRAAAFALANLTPIATAPAPTAAEPTEPAAAPTGEMEPVQPADGAEPAEVTEGEPAKPAKVPWTEWDTVHKDKAKVRAREEKVAAREAAAEARIADAEARLKHPVLEALSKKDLPAVLRQYAKDHGITYQKAIDELTYHELNGKQSPEVAARDLQAEQDRLRKEFEADKAKTTEAQTAAFEAQSKATFAGWLSVPDNAAKYPITATHSAQEIGEASWVIAKQYRDAHDGNWPTREHVAAELERGIRAHLASQAATYEKFKALTAPPGQATVKPGEAASPDIADGTGDHQPGGGAVKTRTLTNGSAARRSGPVPEPKTREDRRRAAMKLLG